LPARPRSAAATAPVDTLSLPETKELQQLLARRGFDVGKIDGVIGASTRDAIRTMQIKYGLPADGYPSAELLDRLRSG
jgi:peptidoglycan hydrolase-like protein with peptidoglycan-binding domain